MTRVVIFAAAVVALRAATVQGVVRDPHGNPLSGATVELKAAGQSRTAISDSRGAWHFDSLPAGTYELHAAKPHVGESETFPFTLAFQETETLDFSLSPADQPPFFDQPTFVVAGVTDPLARGGHGADPVSRSAETLSKDTAALRTNDAPPATAEQLSAAIALEPNRPDLHHALADLDETLGNCLEAVREYQRAAELQSSEPNLFDWGVELLKHRATDQAVEIFAKAHDAYPRSARILLGLGVALYSRGAYDDAAELFFEAADLNPVDPNPYIFLGRLPEGPTTSTPGYLRRMKRFATLNPSNAQANYDYAMCLWRRHENVPLARELLEKAVTLDPNFAPAWVALGSVLAADYYLPAAIDAYRKATAADPNLPEAHYRLAQALQRTGEPDEARGEIERYRDLSRQAAENAARERAAIQEFVFTLRDVNGPAK